MAILYSVGADRLGGRLSSLINTLRISADYGMVPAVFWNRAHHTYPDLDQPELLFAPAFIQSHFLPASFAELGALRGPDGIPPFIHEVCKTYTEKDFRTALRRHQPFMMRSTGLVQLPWEKDSATVKKAYMAAGQKVMFSDRCRATLDHIAKQFENSETFAVHLRRGDIIRDAAISSTYWHGRYIPDEYYVAAIAQIRSEGRNIMIFSDDSEAKDVICQRFPDLLTLDRFTDRAELPRPVYDVVEAMTMSRCEGILAPTLSAFSQTASEIGNAPLMRIFDVLAPDVIAECTHMLRNRLRCAPETFLTEGEHQQVALFLARDPHVRPYT